jgi:hypothetical protein
MMSLVDELKQKQPLKFQIEDVNKDFQITFSSMEKTLSKNNEGIFNLNSKINMHSAEALTDYLKRNNQDYNFELNYNVTNYEIMFKKKEGVKN